MIKIKITRHVAQTWTYFVLVCWYSGWHFWRELVTEETMTRQPLNLLENLHKTLLQFLNPFTASSSQVRQARAQILKTGLSNDTNLTTKLLSLYANNLGVGVQIHCSVIKQGLVSDKCIVSALIDMYGKCACTLEMSRLFDEMDQTDVGACNALVTGLSRNGLVDNALEIFRWFKGQGMEPNIVLDLDNC